MRSRLAVLAAIAFAAPLAGAEPIPITGEVVGMDGKPLAGVEARLLAQLSAYDAARALLAGKEPEPAATAKSDAAGRFRLTAPRTGMWVVEVRSGSVDARFEITPLTGPLQLPRLKRREDPHWGQVWDEDQPYAGDRFLGGRFVPQPTWVVGPAGWPGAQGQAPPSGCRRMLKIVSAERPVAGALVLAGTVPQDLSNFDGLLTVTAACTSPPEIEIGAPDGSRATVELPEGNLEQPLRVPLPPRRRAHGRVLDAHTGQPVAGALVWPEGEAAAWVETDAKGDYRAPVPAADAPRFHAAAPGYFPDEESTATSGPEPLPGPTLRLTAAVTVAGKVVDEQGRPVAGAELAARPKEPEPLQSLQSLRTLQLPVMPYGSAVSDPAGHFSFQIPAGRSHELEATHPDYAPEVVQIAAPTAGKPVPRLRLVMKSGTTAFGRVETLDGEPIPGAKVVLVRSPEARNERLALLPAPIGPSMAAGAAVTDEEGRFALSRLAPGRYDLGAAADGFVLVTLRGLAIPEAAQRHDLGTLALDRAASLAGRVVDRSGDPIAEAHVQIAVADREDAVRLALTSEGNPQTTTDADGEFSLLGLAPGTATLTVFKPDYAWAHLPVEIPAPEPLEIVLSPALQIVCRVVDEAGKPLTSFTIVVRPQDRSTSSGHGKSGSSGVERIPVDAPGRYEVSASAPGLLSASRIVEVSAERPSPDVTLTLPAGAVVVGRVTNAEGVPLPDAVVTWQLDDSHQWSRGDAASGTSDGAGFYRVAGVAPGHRWLTAELSGAARQVRDLEVQPGENRLDFQLAAGPSISGRVVAADGTPVAGAMVSLTGDDQTVASGADGTFHFASVTPGMFWVTAQKDGFAPGTLEGLLSAGEPVAGLEIRLERGGAILGRVSGLDAADLAKVQVSAMSDHGNYQARLDHAGTFRFEGLGAARWVVFAHVETRLVQAEVTVTAGQEAIVELEMKPGFSLTGVVLSRGLPAAGYQVYAAGLSGGSGVADTASDGSFAIEGLAAGRYELLLQKGSALEPRYRQLLELSGDRELTIELPGQRLSGRVVDTAGDPLAEADVVMSLEASAVREKGVTDAEGRFVLEGAAAGPLRLVAQKHGFAAAELRLEVPEQGDVEGLVLTLAPATALLLDVMGLGGGPLTSVEAALLSAGGQTVATGRHSVGPDGRVEIKSAAPGAYRLLVHSPESAMVELDVEIPGGPIPVALPRAAVVKVQVPAMASIFYISCLTVWSDRGEPFRAILDGAVTTTWTLYAGRAYVFGLPAGTWRFVAALPDGRRWERQLAVTAGEHAELVIE